MFRISLTLFNKRLLNNKLGNNSKVINDVFNKFYSSDLKEKNHVKQIEVKSNLLTNIIDDPDTFGTLSETRLLNQEKKKYENDEEDEENNKFKPFKRLSTKQYADIIKSYIGKGKIKEAIDMLEIKIIKEDKVTPENYLYNLIIGACGNAGYTKKAFMLYNDMKKRNLKIHPSTYTSLFNACANSPWISDGLARANKLREIIIEKQIDLNDSNYHAMIKAFGRCGDLVTAFSIVDEMITKKMCLKSETFNFLLQACINDKDHGFRHALIVWRKMMQKKIPPNLYSFNLILRATRDCGIGDLETTTKLIEQILSTNKKKIDSQKSIEKNVLELKQSNVLNGLFNDFKKTIVLNPILEGISNPLVTEINSKEDGLDFLNDIQDVAKLEVNHLKINNIETNLPNLLAKTPCLGNLVTLSEINKPHDRLFLIGGLNGFLNEMKSYNIQPDIKTFTQLLGTIPPTIAAEKRLIKQMENLKATFNVDFFNMLIKNRSMRNDHDNAKKVLELIYSHNLKPDLITFGVLALSCRTRSDARELIEMMESNNFRINAEILGAMLQQGCYQTNFKYILEIMEICLKEKVKPNSAFLEHLEKFQKKFKKMIYDKEKQKFVESSYFKEWSTKFNYRYPTWLKEIEKDENCDAHPWDQFRESNSSFNKIKFDNESKFKPKRLSRFRVKTSLKN